MENKEIIYISGKITGTTDYLERFDRAEKKLLAEGYTVINPARVMEPIPKSMHYDLFMELSFVMIEYCDAIYMLPDWKDSRGAKLEHQFAIEKGLEIIYEPLHT